MNTPVMQSHSIYPGEFVPVIDEEEIKSQLQFSDSDYFILPNVKVKDLADTYAVDLAAPGMERQEFVVYGDDNLLLIGTAENKDIAYGAKPFRCHISLPSDADTELTVAEFKSGILHFYIPKTKQLFKHPCTRIVVY